MSDDFHSPPAPAVPEPPPPPSPSSPPSDMRKSKIPKGILVSMILLLLALPVGLYYVNQQKSLNDVRNRAATPGPYPPSGQCTRNSCPTGYVCHCQDGNQCFDKQCEPDDETKNPCENVWGRHWCVNEGGEAYTCCAAGYTCGSNGEDGCYPEGNTNSPRPTDKPGNTDTPPPGNTNTPTPTSVNTNTPTPTTVTNTNTPTPTTVTNTNTPTPTTVTNTNTPTPTTPGNTSTPTPTTPFVGCNGACTVNSDCSSDLVCIDTYCRNATCPEKTTCACDIAARPTPKTPVSGTGPSILGAFTIVGGFLLVLLGLAL